MILEVGKAGKCRFVRGIKKTNIFECGPNGMVVEREKNIISLYATNNRCSEIYCIVTLGGNEILKKNKFVGVAYSPNVMLLDGNDIMVVVDFARKKVAVNKSEIKVEGRKDWGEDARMPWEPWFNAMFGLPVGEAELAAAEAVKNRNSVEEAPEAPAEPAENAMEKFWAWFGEHEDEIVEQTLAGGEEAEIITARLRIRLAVVFPYEKPENIEFRLGGDGEKNELAVYHFNKERMKHDAEELGKHMPEDLKARWKYFTEA